MKEEEKKVEMTTSSDETGFINTEELRDVLKEKKKNKLVLNPETLWIFLRNI